MQSEAAGRARALHCPPSVTSLTVTTPPSFVHLFHKAFAHPLSCQTLCQAPGIQPVPPTDLVYALRSLESKEGGRA